MSAKSCLHLGGKWDVWSVTCQEEVTSGAPQVLSMITSNMDAIIQLLGESVTTEVSANSCLHLGGRLGWWSVTSQEEVTGADMENVHSKPSAAWVIYFGPGKILAGTYAVLLLQME